MSEQGVVFMGQSQTSRLVWLCQFDKKPSASFEPEIAGSVRIRT